MADFHDVLAGLVEEGGQAGAVAADTFQSPATTAGNVLAGEVQQAPVATSIGGRINAGQNGADRADGCGGEGIAVGVDADDAVDLFCEHSHAVVLLDKRTAVVGVGLGGVTAWQNCDESRRDGGQAADQANGVGQSDGDVRQTSRGYGRL